MTEQSQLECLRDKLADCERIEAALSPGHDKNKYREQAKVLRADIAKLEAWERKQERARVTTNGGHDEGINDRSQV